MPNAPQSAFSLAILRIRARSSNGIRGRPGRKLSLQKRRHPERCQPIIVAGCTTGAVARHEKAQHRVADRLHPRFEEHRGAARELRSAGRCRNERPRTGADDDVRGLACPRAAQRSQLTIYLQLAMAWPGSRAQFFLRQNLGGRHTGENRYPVAKPSPGSRPPPG